MTDLHCTLNCIFVFEVIPIVFHAVQNHHAEQCASEVSQLEEIINYLSATFSYRADNYNFKKKPIFADNDMVADI